MKDTMMMKPLLAGLTIAAAVLFAAPAAADIADTAPDPSGVDTTSYGSYGDNNLGFDSGTGGYSVALGGYRYTSWGPWPTSNNLTVGPDYEQWAVTDYSYEGGIESRSSWQTPTWSYVNHFEVTPTEYSQDSTTRTGSTTYVCHDGVCVVS